MTFPHPTDDRAHGTIVIAHGKVSRGLAGGGRRTASGTAGHAHHVRLLRDDVILKPQIEWDPDKLFPPSPDIISKIVMLLYTATNTWAFIWWTPFQHTPQLFPAIVQVHALAKDLHVAPLVPVGLAFGFSAFCTIFMFYLPKFRFMSLLSLSTGAFLTIFLVWTYSVSAFGSDPGLQVGFPRNVGLESAVIGLALSVRYLCLLYGMVRSTPRRRKAD
jgi:hypothetical protein